LNKNGSRFIFKNKKVYDSQSTELHFLGGKMPFDTAGRQKKNEENKNVIGKVEIYILKQSPVSFWEKNLVSHLD
jgi:hypothetical protein